jgi:hypothetical protein
MHSVMHVLGMQIPLLSVNILVVRDLIHLPRDFAYWIQVEVRETAANFCQNSSATCGVS